MEKQKLTNMILTALFAAIIVVMSLTPLGYLNVGVLSITMIPIIVSIAAITLGPTTGLIMGTIFGITSLVQCFGMNAFGTTLMGINKVYTVFICLVPRMLDGWLTGIIYKGLSKIDKTKWLSLIVTGFCGAALNTVLFMSGLYFLFGRNSQFISAYGSYNIITLFIAMAGINGLAEILACTIVTPPVAGAINIYKSKIKR